jgi:methylenetetrahydrofolate dehydrogenase (NADP+)/methenyltetrahydrofolate cyclohydrolase
VARRADAFASAVGRRPGLAIVQPGPDPAAAQYARQIERAFARRHLTAEVTSIVESTSSAALGDLLDQLARDEATDSILVQLPLPAQLSLDDVIAHLPVHKDVEGIHPFNAGALARGRSAPAPSTAVAGLEMLRAAGFELAGCTAVVVGRSPIVGRPLAELLVRADATVTVCHTRTRDLGEITRQAEVLLVAAGRAGLIDATMVRPGATVLDFGTNVLEDRVVGDVDFASVSGVAGAITPVPGGIGPITTAVLGRTLLDLAERNAAQADPAS